jgi:hypothetical protein
MGALLTVLLVRRYLARGVLLLLLVLVLSPRECGDVAQLQTHLTCFTLQQAAGTLLWEL